jgi:hypothetical protein
MKLLVLSAVLPNSKETILLGVYSDYDKMKEASDKWKEESKGYWLYYDVMKIDGDPIWTNEQRAV